MRSYQYVFIRLYCFQHVDHSEVATSSERELSSNNDEC